VNPDHRSVSPHAQRDGEAKLLQRVRELEAELAQLKSSAAPPPADSMFTDAEQCVSLAWKVSKEKLQGWFARGGLRPTMDPRITLEAHSRAALSLFDSVRAHTRSDDDQLPISVNWAHELQTAITNWPRLLTELEALLADVEEEMRKADASRLPPAGRDSAAQRAGERLVKHGSRITTQGSEVSDLLCIGSEGSGSRGGRNEIDLTGLGDGLRAGLFETDELVIAHGSNSTRLDLTWLGSVFDLAWLDST
jgi:hypothetical protein